MVVVGVFRVPLSLSLSLQTTHRTALPTTAHRTRQSVSLISLLSHTTNINSHTHYGPRTSGNMENGEKFSVPECVRLTSIVCTSEQQVQAAQFLELNKLAEFTDLVNTEDVEADGDQKTHWIE